MVLEF
jgi:uncharacterized protein YjbI with pentapeptide repeats